MVFQRPCNDSLPFEYSERHNPRRQLLHPFADDESCVDLCMMLIAMRESIVA
jgi:hypothetical protein